MVFLVTTLLLGAGLPAVVPNDLLEQERAIAWQFESRVHIAALPFQPHLPQIRIETRPAISYFDGETIREARFNELPSPVQAIFNQWAADTTDQPSGEKLFADMFTDSSSSMSLAIG